MRRVMAFNLNYSPTSMTQGTLGHSLLVTKGTAMKQNYDFKGNEYTERIRIKKPRHHWLKENFRKLGFKSAAALLDDIMEEYIKPNLFRKRK